MGKNRNKNKKIHKQRDQPSSIKAQHKKQQKEGEQVIEAKESNMNQQLAEHEGIFQQFANENQNAMEIEGEDKLQTQRVLVQKCQLGSGSMFILHVGKCYKILNKSTYKSDISIIDGSIVINGRTFKQLFFIKAQHSVIIQAKPNRNQKQIINKEAQGMENQNEQLKKQVQVKAIKKKKKVMEENVNKLNKNVKQIYEKIMSNKEIRQRMDKQKEVKTNGNSQQVLNFSGELLNQKLVSYFHDYEQEQNVLIWSQSSEVQISLCEKDKKPWEGIGQKKYIGKGETTLLVGPKNTGKSMFCNYLQNVARNSSQEICILDLDIGRNRTYPGCISLFSRDSKGKTEQISIWVGQYTPLNSIPIYISAINHLYGFYKQKYFTSSLVVNTMGYLSGIGELILYEIFNILKPQRVLFMEGPQNQQHYLLNNVRHGISSGSYIDRLYFKIVSNSTKTSTKIQKYTNLYADQKSAPQRFQALLTMNPIQTVEDLIMMILGRKLIKINKHLQMYRNSKTGKSWKIENCHENQTDMRIILLGKFRGISELFSVNGVGYGWNGQIFCDPSIINLDEIDIGLISDGIDFQRNFYQINQSRIIQMEEVLGHQLPYVYPIFKALGSKGMRNNPGKKITGVQR